MVYLSIYAGEWNIDSKITIITQQMNDVLIEEVNIPDLQEFNDLSSHNDWELNFWWRNPNNQYGAT